MRSSRSPFVSVSRCRRPPQGVEDRPDRAARSPASAVVCCGGHQSVTAGWRCQPGPSVPPSGYASYKVGKRFSLSRALPVALRSSVCWCAPSKPLPTASCTCHRLSANRPDGDLLVHAKAEFIPAWRARIPCGNEAPHDVVQGTLVKVLSDPMLIDQFTDVHAPCIASSDQRGTRRRFCTHDAVSTRKREQDCPRGQCWPPRPVEKLTSHRSTPGCYPVLAYLRRQGGGSSLARIPPRALWYSA